jgi:hypothetical protein
MTRRRTIIWEMPRERVEEAERKGIPLRLLVPLGICWFCREWCAGEAGPTTWVYLPTGIELHAHADCWARFMARP